MQSDNKLFPIDLVMTTEWDIIFGGREEVRKRMYDFYQHSIVKNRLKKGTSQVEWNDMVDSTLSNFNSEVLND